jgi:glycosyltransferase involved in cell wall biosynthesis
VRRFKVLLAAYACRPGQGSEPGVGWNMARELAQHHQVWVLTRENNRPAIEAELAQHPIANLEVIYCPLPGIFRRWQQGSWAVHIHYALWQFAAYAIARRLLPTVHFDVSHHVTYGRYCTPSFLAFLPIPFVWGPVGGGESAPFAFWQDFSLRGWFYELLRNLSRGLGEINPLVRYTAQRSAIVLASTPETRDRLQKLGAQRIEMVSGQTGINAEELAHLKTLAQDTLTQGTQSTIFLSLGRLLHWKGFHLGLQAFAQANLPDAEYWIVGEGTELSRLEALVEKLGIGNRVRFWGSLPRDKALSLLGGCNVLVHPSLHDFSPTVCLEAMAAGKPVLCLELGGPGCQVTEETGWRVAVGDRAQTIQAMAEAMVQLATDAPLRQRMGTAGQMRVEKFYNWETKGQDLTQLYETLGKAQLS